MEMKKPQKSTIESKLFKIPIEEYENDIETESAKGKKNEILNLFKNYNKILSNEEFKEIKDILHESCRKGDLDLIKIYLSKTIEKDTLKFKIDESTRTASLFRVNGDIEELTIPRTVEYESVEYSITSICGTCYRIKTLKFVEDSAVRKIYKDAFSYSSNIQEIYFPASLKELEEGWCSCTNKLTNITISPSNGQFMMKEDKYLLRKSDPNKDEFDVFLFARRDINEISIPSYIKIISPWAFMYCRNLAKVEFQADSNLQIIGKYAFSFSKIDRFYLPSKVSKICENSFYCCNNLTKIEIPENSNLQTIEDSVFLNTKLEEIYFPANLKELKEGWCLSTRNLTKITVSPLNSQFMMKEDKYLLGKSDPSKDEFDILRFGLRDIKEISIPSNIKIISSHAFRSCRYLSKVIISTDSNLQTIGKFAFSLIKIKDFFIPPKVTKICKCAFQRCQKLTKVEIPPNSDLQTIEQEAFSLTKIREIFIPSKVSKICNNAFYDCKNLTKVEIPTNSNLQTIERYAFSKSKIKDIFIPSKVSIIDENAFYSCSNFRIIEISEESKLVSFPMSAFDKNTDLIIMIPTSLKKVGFFK